MVAEAVPGQIAEHFATELAALPTAQRDFIVDAVLVLTSYDAYTIHTRLLATRSDQIRAAWTPR